MGMHDWNLQKLQQKASWQINRYSDKWNVKKIILGEKLPQEKKVLFVLFLKKINIYVRNISWLKFLYFSQLTVSQCSWL